MNKRKRFSELDATAVVQKLHSLPGGVYDTVMGLLQDEERLSTFDADPKGAVTIQIPRKLVDYMRQAGKRRGLCLDQIVEEAIDLYVGADEGGNVNAFVAIAAEALKACQPMIGPLTEREQKQVNDEAERLGVRFYTSARRKRRSIKTEAQTGQKAK